MGVMRVEKRRCEWMDALTLTLYELLNSWVGETSQQLVCHASHHHNPKSLREGSHGSWGICALEKTRLICHLGDRLDRLRSEPTKGVSSEGNEINAPAFACRFRVGVLGSLCLSQGVIGVSL